MRVPGLGAIALLFAISSIANATYMYDEDIPHPTLFEQEEKKYTPPSPPAKLELFRHPKCSAMPDTVLKAPVGKCLPLKGTNKFYMVQCSPKKEETPKYQVPSQQGYSRKYEEGSSSYSPMDLDTLPMISVEIPSKYIDHSTNTQRYPKDDFGYNMGDHYGSAASASDDAEYVNGYLEMDDDEGVNAAGIASGDDEEGDGVYASPPTNTPYTTTTTNTEPKPQLRSSYQVKTPPAVPSPAASSSSSSNYAPSSTATQPALVLLCSDDTCEKGCKQVVVTESRHCDFIKPRNWFQGVTTQTKFYPKCLHYAPGYCADNIPEVCMDLIKVKPTKNKRSEEEKNSWTAPTPTRPPTTTTTTEEHAPSYDDGHQQQQHQQEEDTPYDASPRHLFNDNDYHHASRWTAPHQEHREKRPPANCTSFVEVKTDKCIAYETKRICEKKKKQEHHEQTQGWKGHNDYDMDDHEDSYYGLADHNDDDETADYDNDWSAPRRPAACRTVRVCKKYLVVKKCARICYPEYCAREMPPKCDTFEKDAIRAVRVTCPKALPPKHEEPRWSY